MLNLLEINVIETSTITAISDKEDAITILYRAMYAHVSFGNCETVIFTAPLKVPTDKKVATVTNAPIWP